MKYLAFLFFVGIGSFCNAQNDQDGVRLILKASIGNVKNSSFYVYEPAFKAKAIYKDTAQAVNIFPEQLMSSVMSENSISWYRYNNLEEDSPSIEVQNRYRKMEEIDKETNYFELLHKFEFSTNESDYAIIKFRLITDNNKAPVIGAYSLVKVNEKWKRTSTPQTFNMTLMHVFFKTDKMRILFKGVKTGVVLMDSLMDTVYKNESLNMDKLYVEFETWLKQNQTNKLDYFTEQPNWN